jgi:cysteine desulfurase
MGLSEETARGAQRFTLGHTSTATDVEALVAALPNAYRQAKKAGMAGHISSIETAGTKARRQSEAGTPASGAAK